MRFKELDALRGIAAMLVVLFHFTMNTEKQNLGFNLGVTGVDLFFMISGFVILLSLNHVKYSYQFVINRVSRLYPTYWACVTFTFLLINFTSIFRLTMTEFVHYLANMSMFQFYFRVDDLDGPYWTMIIEMIFYIVMLFLFHFKYLKYLNLIGMLSMSACVLMNVFYSDNVWVVIIMKGVPFFQFIPLFFAGTIFYTIYTTNKNHFKNYIMLACCLLSQISLFEYGGRSNGFVNQEEYAIMVLLYFIIFTLFVHGKLGFLVNRVTLFLGEISFALYLVHQMISVNYIIPYLTETTHLNFWLIRFIALVVVLILGTLITNYIGAPYSKKLKEKLNLMVHKK
ncbi:acyltransferase [uncultured Cytophaga sp.]|uniref:acyltransferase family protein n=1 Tax=uncultured Cytophaga sp. TaxID=160238 RepID=UPI0026085497|nr:acyltransferase [uncultured Cytophaga sp.]